MQDSFPFFIIDDDKSIIQSLSPLVTKLFPNAKIRIFDSGEEAWSALLKNELPAIIMIDSSLQGLGALQFLKKAKNFDKLQNHYYIVITSFTDHNLNIEALKEGADEFLNKPLSIDELLQAFKNAKKLISLQFEKIKLENELKASNDSAKEAFKSIKNTFKNIIQSRSNEIMIASNQIAKCAKWFANELELESPDYETLIDAAELALLGRMQLPDTNIKESVRKDGMVKSPKMEQVSLFAFETLKDINKFDKIALALKHIYENFDGTGFPDNIKGSLIPMPSRILSVIVFYHEELILRQKPHIKIFEELEKESRRIYDYKIVALLDQYFANENKAKEESIDVNVMISGIQISRNIFTQSGLKLIAANTRINDENLSHIKSIIKSDPIIGKIWILKNEIH